MATRKFDDEARRCLRRLLDYVSEDEFENYCSIKFSDGTPQNHIWADIALLWQLLLKRGETISIDLTEDEAAQGVKHMAKRYLVRLVDYACFNVAVEAENAQEAEQKAKQIVLADKDYPVDDAELVLNDECDGDPPGVEEIDNETWWRCIATPPEDPKEREQWEAARAPLSDERIAQLKARFGL